LILRKVLIVLVIALPLLLVAFSVVMAFYAIVQAGQDAVAANALWWIAMGILLLGTIDLVAIVGVLGIQAIDDSD